MNIKGRCFNLVGFYTGLTAMKKKSPAEVKALQKDPLKTNRQITSKTAKEVNGRSGPEPTRYGDWEKNGRCIDF